MSKTRVPNGLLLDYAMEFAELSAFNGATLTNENTVTIDLAPGHSDIVKPLIVAEGFDLGAVFSPENINGMNTYEKTFRRSLDFSGSTALQNLLWSPNKQYDIIYVDWNNGSDYFCLMPMLRSK